MSARDCLRLMYALLVDSGMRRSSELDQRLEVVAGAGLTVDDRRNEREICQDMLEDAAPLDDLFTSLMREMKGSRVR